MAKRRRVDSGDSYVSSDAGGWDQSSQHRQQQYAPELVSSSFGSQNASVGVEYAAGADGAAGGAAQGTTGAAALNESSEQWPSLGASPYPDVASYSQQPYFFQQTDPSTYNSPWPPAADTTASFAGNNYSVPAPSAAQGTMPFFPSAQTQTESMEAAEGASAFDAANSSLSAVQGYEQAMETSPQYAYVQSGANGQPRGDVPAGQPSAFYFEDANMHMKIQSLPILDNLV